MNPISRKQIWDVREGSDLTPSLWVLVQAGGHTGRKVGETETEKFS